MTMTKVYFYLALVFSVESHAWQKEFDAQTHLAVDLRTEVELFLNPAVGAKHISMSDLEVKSSELDKSMTMLLFCESGGRASKAKKMLEQKGFTKIVNIKSWREWNNFYEKKTK